MSALLAEMEHSKQRQSWPDHPAAQAGMVAEKAAQLMTVCMDKKYQSRQDGYSSEQHQDRIWEAALQTAAVAVRFLEHFQISKQHEKGRQNNAVQQECSEEPGAWG